MKRGGLKAACVAWRLLEQQPEQHTVRQSQQEQSHESEQQQWVSLCSRRRKLDAGVRLLTDSPERAYRRPESVPVSSSRDEYEKRFGAAGSFSKAAPDHFPFL